MEKLKLTGIALALLTSGSAFADNLTYIPFKVCGGIAGTADFELDGVYGPEVIDRGGDIQTVGMGFQIVIRNAEIISDFQSKGALPMGDGTGSLVKGQYIRFSEEIATPNVTPDNYTFHLNDTNIPISNSQTDFRDYETVIHAEGHSLDISVSTRKNHIDGCPAAGGPCTGSVEGVMAPAAHFYFPNCN